MREKDELCVLRFGRPRKHRLGETRERAEVIPARCEAMVCGPGDAMSSAVTPNGPPWDNGPKHVGFRVPGHVELRTMSRAIRTRQCGRHVVSAEHRPGAPVECTVDGRVRG